MDTGIIIDMNEDLVLRAAKTAAILHEGQTRKYGIKLPYIIHPIRVAGMIAIHPDSTREMVAAAYLHDVLEDCDFEPVDLMNAFGSEVFDLVESLTNPSKGSPLSRYERKRMDREHVAQISDKAKLIKLVDRIDNLWDLTQAPDDFLELYLRESRLLLDEALQGVDDVYEMEYERAMSYLRNILTWREKHGHQRSGNRS